MTSLSVAQTTRAQRAADQRKDYTLRVLEAPGARTVEVRKTKDQTTYLVTFTGSRPVCSCEDNSRNPELICKHGTLALVQQRDQGREEQPEETVEDRLPWNAPPFDVEPGEATETPAEKLARILKERELWN